MVRAPRKSQQLVQRPVRFSIQPKRIGQKKPPRPPMTPTRPPTTPTSGKFVDPLVARRQAKLEAQLSAGPPVPKALVGKKKVPVGELVAFFDQEKA